MLKRTTTIFAFVMLLACPAFANMAAHQTSASDYPESNDVLPINPQTLYHQDEEIMIDAPVLDQHNGMKLFDHEMRYFYCRSGRLNPKTTCSI